jgi:hypothetical protein
MDTNERLTTAESPRINGSKSNGPCTEAGKEHSSQNRTIHGIYSTRVVLRNESQDTYNELEAMFIELFQPRDAYEVSCLTDMIVARWRIRRLRTADTANIELAMEDARATLHSAYNNLTPAHELALAYRSMPHASSSANLLRLEDQQQRLYDRSYRALVRHRGRNTAFPSSAAVAGAEAGLPPDNLVSSNLFETKTDIQNCGLEPETQSDPPPVSRVASSEPEPGKSAADGQQRDPDRIYKDQYDALQPILEALDGCHPELRRQVARALLKHKARTQPPEAA